MTAQKKRAVPVQKTNSKRRKKVNEHKVNQDFAAAFGSIKSPHHNCSYDECHSCEQSCLHDYLRF